MKAALLIVLSLSALAYAGPAYNKNANSQIGKQQQQQQQYMTTGNTEQTKAIESLKQWCFSSQMSQTELTGAFKRLVGIIKSAPLDQQTESAVMNERICQGAIVQKSSQSGQTLGQTGTDAQAHELIKDVYMDSLMACESRECMQQLLKIINSNQVDQIRASYYMTRLAVTEKKSIKDETEVKQLVESFVRQQQQPASEAVERQKLFAVTSVLGKLLQGKQEQQQQQISSEEISGEHKQLAEQVAKTIVERYIRPVSKQDVEQYQQQPEQQPELSKKIAKRNAALKALANIPAPVLKACGQVEQELSKIAEDKQEQSSARQSAIECLQGNEQSESLLKQITFDQEEPIEVRVAAYRALMMATCSKDTAETKRQQMAEQIVKHCEEQSNQQDDEQFVLYVVSHLDNLRTSQQPEQQTIKEAISKNKQLYMQIQLLNKKFKQQLSQVRSSSRNYQLSQGLSQLESALIIEGDMIFESSQGASSKQQQSVLPKVVRFNMSMPIMGETVNVVEVTVRQNQMDQELLGALKIAQGAKFSSESVSKVVDSFKSSVSKSRAGAGAGAPECDMSIKVENKNILYISSNDFKSTSASAFGNKRDTRSIHGIQSTSTVGQLIEELIQHLKRQPIAFNRGINVNINERLAKLLDIEASMIAGLRFETRTGANSQSSDDFEISAEIEPRFAFEAIVGPAKVSSKKLLQRLSTKTAVGLRLRYKANELVDVQVDLPMTNMDIFTIESQLVERSSSVGSTGYSTYNYLPESIYGQEDIYAPEEDFVNIRSHLFNGPEQAIGVRKMKRSIFESSNYNSGLAKFTKMIKGKQSSFAHSIETPEEIARATGLRGKLRVVASPKDMSFFAQVGVQKTEPSMQGYRVQVQRSQRNADQKQYTLTMSTPGSRTDRTMQVRAITQCNNQRTLLKSDIQATRLAATMQLELIHDGRQYGAKLEMASSRGKQWRHQLECGVQRSQQQQAAGSRLNLTYKPYLSVQSTELRRPVQLQGVLSYQQQSPKSVISYELKSPTSGDFVQGKLIFEQRPSVGKRAGVRRSLKSPIMVIVSQSEVVMSAELVGQLDQHAIKTHQAVDWSANQLRLDSTFNAVYKNLRKGQEEQLTGSVKLNQLQQVFVVERRNPQQARKNVRLALESQLKPEQGAQSGQHQLTAEARFANNQLVAYKQKVDYSRPSRKSTLVNYQLELVSTASKINEKAQGRIEIDAQPMMKVVRAQVSANQRNGQLNVQYSSPVEHQIELSFEGKQYQHRSNVRAAVKSAAKFEVESMTKKQGQKVNQFEIRAYPNQETVIFEFQQPGQQTHVAGELKFKQGEQSSLAVQTGRFSSKAELVISKLNRSNKHSTYVPSWMRPIWGHQYQFKGDLKDQLKKELYAMESAFNGFEQQQPSSYFRFNSPAMRSEFQFEPRTYETSMAAYGRKKRSTGFTDTTLEWNPREDLPFTDDMSWMTRGRVVPCLPKEAEKEAAVQAVKIVGKAIRFMFDIFNSKNEYRNSIEYMPENQRINFTFDTKPARGATSSNQWWSPMRATGDLSSSFFTSQPDQRPSSLTLNSNWADLDLSAKPIGNDDTDAYVRLSALSRNRRSTFNKHESEIRYNKKHGYKAWAKHQDKQNKLHSADFESDQDPKKWAKMSYQSEKLGQGKWEHMWRNHQTNGKRGHQHYQNKLYVDAKSPSGKWGHSTDFQWEEPVSMTGRIRRHATTYYEDDSASNYANRFSVRDYLKHSNARLQSQVSKDQRPLYKLDFDYQPQESRANLNLNMPSDMLHSSSFEYQPNERTYRIASSLANERTKEPTYELVASTKPMFAGNQEQYEGLYGQSFLGRPLKLDYSDKYGRQARFDYDNSPLASGDAGLRLKRAAVYFKDDSSDFEHDSTYDFYPIPSKSIQSRKSIQGDYSYGNNLSIKSQTKYGPVKVQFDTSEDMMKVEFESPVMNAKLVGNTSGQRQVAKLYVSNKEQTYQLAKIVRKSPVLNQLEMLYKLAQKVDQGRFEHESELVMSLVESVFKLKSQTSYNQRPVVFVEGELNKQQNKAYFKIDGPRVKGELVVDLTNKNMNLQFEVDEKRTMHHYTRLARLSNKFYSLDSSTSYKQQPLVKVSGKVSSMIFEEPEHLFSCHRRRSGLNKTGEAHVSTVEAIVYQPKPIQISGVYDCVKNDVHVAFKDLKDKSESALFVHFDEQNEKIYVDAQKSSPRGIDYKVHKTINVPELIAY